MAEEMIMFDRVAPITGYTPKARTDWLHPRQEDEAEKTGWRHAGIDIFPKQKTIKAQTVYAPENCTVYYVDTKCASGTHGGGYGPGVLGLAGQSGVFHWLAHMDPKTFVVKLGNAVKIGQPVGAVVPTWKFPELQWETRLRKYCPYSKDFPFPWTITCDPWAWLQEKIVKASQAAAGVAKGIDIDRDKYRPGGYPIHWEAKSGVFSAAVQLKAAETPTRSTAGALFLVGSLIAGGWYGHRKGWW